ncbi:MAG: c-type cytochrome, partial [Leptospirales bacterium]
DLTMRLSCFFTYVFVISLALSCASDTKEQQATEQGYNLKAKGIYLTHCSACHGTSGSNGTLAPGLKVKPKKFRAGKFLYGSQLDDIIKVITKGVVKNQMPSWRKVLRPKKIRLLAEYTLYIANLPVEAPTPLQM